MSQPRIAITHPLLLLACTKSIGRCFLATTDRRRSLMLTRRIIGEATPPTPTLFPTTISSSSSSSSHAVVQAGTATVRCHYHGYKMRSFTTTTTTTSTTTSTKKSPFEDNNDGEGASNNDNNINNTAAAATTSNNNNKIKKKRRRKFLPPKAAVKLTTKAREFFKLLLEKPPRSDIIGVMLNYNQASSGQPRMVFTFDFVTQNDINDDDEGVSLEILDDGNPKPPKDSIDDGLPKLYVNHNGFMKVLGCTLDVDIDKNDGTMKPILYDAEGNIKDPNL